MVARLGFQAARARSLRNVLATEVVSGLAVIAIRKSETVCEGLASLVGPDGWKYGGPRSRSGLASGTRWTLPFSGSVVHAETTTPPSSTATSTRATRARVTGRVIPRPRGRRSAPTAVDCA